jgi:acyl carrier protein
LSIGISQPIPTLLLPAGDSSLKLQRSQIVQIISGSVANYSSQQQSDAISEESRLIGAGRVLDSIGLVSMLVELETRIADESNLSIRLMDDRAMSQSKSPFRTVGTLADYIDSLLPEVTES